jgi:hypothetical protein
MTESGFQAKHPRMKRLDDSIHAYPTAALIADYARASAGLGFGGLALFLPMHPALTLASMLAAVFLLGFGLRTALRQLGPLRLDDEAITITGPFGQGLQWDRLDRLTLRYYSTRRDRKHGWMELRLRFGRQRLTIESQIDGFAEIVAAAAEAATRRGIALDSSTESNLARFEI